MRSFRFVTQVLPLPVLMALSGCFSQPVVKPLPPLAPLGQAGPAQAEESAGPAETGGPEQAATSGFEEQNVVAPPPSASGAPGAANATAQAATQPGAETAPSAPAAASGAAPAGEIAAAGAPASGALPASVALRAPAERHDAALISDISDFNNVTDLSNHSLNSLIDDSLPAARAASMRTVEQAREQIHANDSVSALQLLSQAISIDPSDPYAYFYLGRVYLAKRNATQALTFLRRAELGFSDNPQWLAETQAFEGCAYELTGNTDKAQEAYRRALSAASGNYLAQVGYARVAAADLRAAPSAPTGGANQAAPESGPSGNPAAAPDEPATSNETATPDQPTTQAEDNGALPSGSAAPDDPAAPPEEEGAGAGGTNAQPDPAGAPPEPATDRDNPTQAPDSAPSAN